MNSEDFRECGAFLMEYISKYLDNIRQRPVLPSVEPGYLRHMIPCDAPEQPEQWKDIMKDIERVIMPGLTHWQSPHFHAYFPGGASYPSVLGELLSAGLGTLGFHWLTSPASTELEVVMMDWMAKLLNLPKHFLSSDDGPGGGLIQGSASEATFSCLLAAQEKTLRRVRQQHPEWDDSYIRGRMVSYSSDHSNSSVEKASRLASMPIRLLETDNQGRLRGSTVLSAVQKDIADGFIPTYVCTAMGTTATCAIDKLEEIGPICQAHHIWLHVDAAYAGAALVCPEYEHLLQGMEFVDSFVFNPHKWFLINFDCSALWIRDTHRIIDVFAVDRIYLNHQQEGNHFAPDFRNWEISLGRRFRSLKVWFTLRAYGATGLREYVRKQVKLAEEFETLVEKDDKFEIVVKSSMGLVCFRMKGDNSLTKRLVARLTARKNIYVISAEIRGSLFIRFVVCSRLCESSDISFAWEEIKSQAQIVSDQEEDQDCEVLSDRHIEEELFIKKMPEESNNLISNLEKLRIYQHTLS